MGNPLGFKQYFLAWLILGGITLLQAMSGTRFIYSACSNLMKRHYGISRMQVNNLIVASESGKVFGCFPTAAKKYLPEWMILVIGLMFGSVGYGAQYLSISTNYPSLSYWQIFFLNVLAGNSICWINTYCDLLVAQNFKHTQDTVTELASSYSGLTGKIYTSLVEGIQGRKLVSEDSSKIYLLLSCLAPATVGLPVALLNCVINVGEYEEAKLFPFVFVIVIATGVYAFIENTAQPFTQMSFKLRVVNFMLVAMLPLVVALLMAARYIITLAKYDTQDTNERVKITVENHETVVTEKPAVGNENNGLKKLVKSVDFWLFYMMNMCGVTLGMVYLNNLEIISESQGYHKPLFLLATSSTFVFFGRVFSLVFTWYTRETSIISKPALTMLIMTSMPLAFFLLIISSKMCLYISTCIIATGLGAITAIVASSTSEFLSTNSNSLINQTNIIPTNVPLGTLLFGYLASLIYDRDGSGDHKLCLGRFKCHHLTFTICGFISSIGTILSFSLYIRTRKNHSQKL